MNKKILLLPIISGLLLSGCTFTIFGKTITIGKPKDEGTTEDGGGSTTPEEKPQIPLLEEYGDYKIADTIVDGGRYLLGIKRYIGTNAGQMRFFNGDYHRDSDGGYSFYLGTTESQNGDVSFAAEIEAISAGNDEFYFKVHTEEENPWNGKYMAVYTAQTSGKKETLSFAALENLTDTTIHVTDAKHNPKEYTATRTADKIINKFKMFKDYDERTPKAPGFMYKHVEAKDDKPYAKFFGTTGDYVSFDIQSEAIALEPEMYDLAHLYVHK